jgi:hypothetical protein
MRGATVDKVQLRHYDYRLDIGALAAGFRRSAVPLNLETDSSFILRGRAVHCQSTTARLAGQSSLIAYMDRYTGPDLNYLSQDVTRFRTECPTYGQYGSMLPVRPPVIYPPGGVILVDVYNSGLVDFAGLSIYFRGQKIYQPGVLPCHVYPERLQMGPYVYNDLVSALAVTSPQGVRDNNIVNIQGDADFVVRSLHVGACAPAPDERGAVVTYREVFIQLRDSDGRAYSNLPVHIDACYGACGSLPLGGSGANLTGDPSIGPFHPSLITPEIHVMHNDFLSYDISRADAFVGGLQPVDIRLAFKGSKVYPL